MAWLDRSGAEMIVGMSGLSVSGLNIQLDPEAIFQEGWLLCDVGEYEQGLGYLRRAVAKGYFVAPTLAQSRHFDALRSDPVFQALLAEAEAGRQRGARRVPRGRRRASPAGPVTGDENAGEAA